MIGAFSSLAPLAHPGHWLSSVAYFLPVIAFLAWLAVVTIRDRRKQRREGSGESGGAG